MRPEIFREYDIRGIVGEDFDADDARLIGHGAGTHLLAHGCRRLGVGRDCRISSDEISMALVAGLRAAGCHVTDIGVCPTPLLYFSIPHLGLDGGIMVTASHNPPRYNGFKVCRRSDSVHGAELQELREIVSRGVFASGRGELAGADILPAYRERLLADLRLARRLRVGVDAGNGTAGVVAVPILEALGCEVHPLYCEMDGTFPHHEADPTVRRNMEDLIDLVQSRRLDVGIAFDGDGDRLGVVDEQGEMLYGDQLMVIFAREILTRKPGATFIGEVKCSQTMYDEIERLGGRAVMGKTGHSLIKKKIKEESAALAGEMSGHLFFSDRYFGFDDATYAAGRFLEILAASPGPASTLLQGLPRTVTTPEIRVDCPDARKFEVVRRVTEHFRARYPVVDIDGVRVLFGDGWGLVRASNTQPALVLRFEALSPERLEEIKRTVTDVLARLSD